MNTDDIVCKSGTYYIRCIVFDDHGKSKELISNSVTTSGTNVAFDFSGMCETVSLPPGQYKLEVWGAKGGNSTGSKSGSYPDSQGGLGGYSCGILKLKETEKVHVYVRCQGQPGNSSDVAKTDGGFPDGGSTINKWTSVPGTGGGSTSMRLKNDTEFSRIIVAGGVGGASGSSGGGSSLQGGFGGGLSGGNCQESFALHANQGAGTQTGSTGGVGCAANGDPGSFGKGAQNKYKSRADSGGGGGGGVGNDNGCSSGGGGSGWIFTESSFKTWKEGDSSNALKFLLNSSYYLSDAKTISGDKEFPKPDGQGTECGHSGNGYAKITPE